MSVISNQRSVIVLSLALAFFAHSAVAYELKASTTANTTANQNGAVSTYYDNSPVVVSTTTPASKSSYSSASSQVKGMGYAYADLGVAKASSFGSANDTVAAFQQYGNSGKVVVSSKASWSDGITILAPGFSGNGVAHVRILTDFPVGNFSSADATGIGGAQAQGIATSVLMGLFPDPVNHYNEQVLYFFAGTEQKAT